MKAFIAELDSKLNLLEKFDIDIWSYLIEKAIVKVYSIDISSPCFGVFLFETFLNYRSKCYFMVQ